MQTRIYATGCHSGLGYEAIKTLLHTPQLEQKGWITFFYPDANAAAAIDALGPHWNVRPLAPPDTGTEMYTSRQTMDLGSLASVRSAASSLKQSLKLSPKQASTPAHDILLLNAAVAKSKRETVMDDDRAYGKRSASKYPSDNLVGEDSRIETTACVNHVAHLVFVSKLASTIVENAKNGRKTRIVFTGSALHRTVKDPSVLDDFFAPSSHASNKPWNLRETYAASKFLQMLGIRALRRRLEKLIEQQDVPAGMVEIVVVQPGFVPQTGLCRESGLLTRLAMKYVLPWMPFVTTTQDAGKYIADACLIDLPEQTESHDQDGFHSSDTLVRSALLEVHQHKQRFGILDPRTADIALQDKWWPAACIDL